MNCATKDISLNRLPGLLGPGIVAALSFILYWATLAPTYLWSDSAKLALYVHEGESFGAGFGTHSLHSFLGHLFSYLPVSLAYSQNLMSAVFAALAAGVLFWTIQAYTQDRIAAGLGAGALAVSHLFWHYAVINETYSLLVCFASIILAFVVCSRIRPSKWLFIGTAFIFGLGFTNHALIVFIAPGAAIIFIHKDCRKLFGFGTLGLCIFAFIVGAAPILLAPLLKDDIQTSFFTSLFSSAQHHSMVFWTKYAGKIGKELLFYPAYLAYQFPTLGIPLGFVGVVTLWRRDKRVLWTLLVMWLLPVLFASSYFKQRQFPMLIPSFLLFSFAIGCGASIVRANIDRVRSRTLVASLFMLLVAAPPLFYIGASSAAKAVDFEMNFIRSLPYRDTVRYFLLPAKQMEYGAEHYVKDAFKQAELNSLILADFNPGMPLVYAQKTLGMRPDLKVEILIDDWYHYYPDSKVQILAWLDEQVRINGRTVYLADNWEEYYRFSEIKNCFTVKRENGPLWKVSYDILKEEK